MKKSELKQIIREEISKMLEETSIQDNVDTLADDLVAKGIVPFAQRTSTGLGALGKFAIKLSTGGKSYDTLKKDIENNYKKTDNSTSLSSQYYFSPSHNLYFYFYKNDKSDKSYKSSLDKMIDWDYRIVTMRKIPKSAIKAPLSN